jgi:hypothetical protein
MIPTPQPSQLPFDTLFFGATGYILGRLSHVNERLLAGVLVIASTANHILFQIANRWIQPHLGFSSEAIYTGTNTLATIATIVAAQQLDLLSRHWAGVLIFGSLAILASRLRILAG